MKTLARHAISLGVAALFFGCGARSAIAPSVLEERMGPNSASAAPLIYAFDVTNESGVAGPIFNYQTQKLYGRIGGRSMNMSGICSNSQGDVFLTGSKGSGPSFTARIYKYAYGATSPSAIVKFSQGVPGGCSADPTTGDVATVASWSAAKSFVVIFSRKFRGSPKTYEFPDESLSVGYDFSGNLFLLYRRSGSYAVAEMHKGEKKFKPISINLPPLDQPYVIQWDGTYLAITTFHSRHAFVTHRIYRYKISGSRATLVGIVTFTKFDCCFVDGGTEPTWIQPNLGIMVAPVDNRSRGSGFVALGVWEYPAGGARVQTYYDVDTLAGATVAVPGTTTP
ncbi:MAG: hypothetical protein JO263_08510 [Candidatus Eremiobacteraeota bacterium]|nr:hypothetical protein [Candidatus Eremiobacteraeota bacterium]